MSKKLLLLVVAVVIVAVAGIYALGYYRTFEAPNTNITHEVAFNIPTGASLQMVLDSIDKYGIVKNKKSFLKVVSKQGYENKIQSGHYVFTPGMNNKYMVNMLRLGWQKPVKVTFNSIRLPEYFAQVIAPQIEADSASIVAMFHSDSVAKHYGYTREMFISMFIPNTYEVYWNTSLPDFFDRMQKEYERFWTPAREEKAVKLGLTKNQVSIIASIVQEETVNSSERPIVARVYLNRLNKNMAFQACPTVKFALRDFNMRRVLKRHVEFDSPYNSYMYKGFMPGPICAPSIEALDAVLNAPNHNYLYFCAKADFSGFHNFSSTFSQHNKYAKEFQDALNKQRIFR